MSDILNGLSEEEIAAYSADPTGEPHIVVGKDRVITVPDALKRIAVQYDHNIETVTFDCPRYWDGHDMSKMAIYVNYMTPDGTLGAYITDNVVVDESDDTIMHFDWTISKHATKVNGNLSFLVCVKNTDDNGNESNHWNSELNRDLYISEGLEVDSESIVNEYPDVITQILLRLNALEEGGGGNEGGSSIGFKKIGFTEDCDYVATSSDGYSAFTAALNEAVDGDTIMVMPGVYKGTSQFLLEKNVDFIGIGKPEIDFPVKIQGGGEFSYENWEWVEMYPSITSKWNGFKFIKGFLVGSMNKADEEIRHGTAILTDCDVMSYATIIGTFTRCNFDAESVEIGHYYGLGTNSTLTDCNISVSEWLNSDAGCNKYTRCNIYINNDATLYLTSYREDNLAGCKIFTPNKTLRIGDNHSNYQMYLGDTLVFADGVACDYEIIGGYLIKGESLAGGY